ncbi:MAG: hypothetical protein IJT68_03915 [Lentisphaeria bacterium]|nr:hypothetical protein [Lentisphaeria bacterium]
MKTILSWGKLVLALFSDTHNLHRQAKKIKGISENSIGWIFSRWANKTMQEDLSVAT